MGIRKYAKQLALGLIISICFQLNLHGVIFAESMGITESAQNQGTFRILPGIGQKSSLMSGLSIESLEGIPMAHSGPLKRLAGRSFLLW